ncbi:signal peptide peptidase SppA, 67K type [Allomyces macrogynus ATCC 38327]|uniref:Signal peptide peptidase SppA, 67K type n=1 Tax=Allomyces macrogynus (strain ATCC 38327) TaxID=578462 RepID=A0A0L0SXC4_ALLM3|nr:signal peptide peptidase SppA, 67K type [Allomyces macrogynus ATCC 38327]|eukprot:KNE67213.1 signal peptide peptidase SppA, 67K type [Allomyces macrogynus ATCC 38327]
MSPRDPPPQAGKPVPNGSAAAGSGGAQGAAGANPDPSASANPNAGPNVPPGSRLGALWKRRPAFRTVVIGFSVAYFISSSVLQYMQQLRRDRMADGTILHWRYSNGSIVEDAREQGGLSGFLRARLAGQEETPVTPISLYDAIQTIRLGKDDKRVRGLVCRFVDDGVAGAPLQFAQLQELRDAVEEFKLAKADQFGEQAVVLAFAETFENQSQYFLASAFDKIIAQPASSLGLIGMSSVTPFFKRLLDRVGITAHAETREEHKSVLSRFTHEKFPPQQKEDLVTLLGDLNDQMLESIAHSRVNLRHTDGRLATSFPDRVAALKDLVALGPLTGTEAVQYGLVDGLGYRDDLTAYLIRVPAKSIAHYLRVRKTEIAIDRLKQAQEKGTVPTRPVTVAMVYVLDQITRHGAKYAASHVARALREAALDPTVDAIVLRVSSPGGDVVASDTLHGVVRRIQKTTGKPVVASYAGMSASGGYYLSASADAIVAMPGTITGSIGVAALQPYISPDLLDKLGVTIDEVHFSKATQVNSILHDRHADPQALARYRAAVDDMYARFLTIVSEGRHMPLDVVKPLAGGRVYTGRAAHAVGLVDVLGGVHDAVHLAAQLAVKRRPELRDRQAEPRFAAVKRDLAKNMPWKEPEDAPESPKHKDADLHAHPEPHKVVAADAKHAHPTGKSVDLVDLPELPEDVTVRVKQFPRQKSFQELLKEQQLSMDLADLFWRGLRTRLETWAGVQGAGPQVRVEMDAGEVQF